MKQKILSWEQCQQACSDAQSSGKKIVSTNGTFDIIHKGHVFLFEEAKKLGDILVVAINSDASVQRYKGNDRPINSQNDRALVLAALSNIDYVCIFEEDTPEEFLSCIKPDVHVKGADWNIQEIPEYKLLQSWGGQCVAIDYQKGYSTTSIIKKSQNKK